MGVKCKVMRAGSRLWILRAAPFLLSTALVAGAGGRPLENADHFVFVSNARVVTLEVVDRESLILNYVNLSDGYELVEAPAVLLVDTRNRSYSGHLIKVDQPSERAGHWKVSELVGPRAFVGLTIAGDYRFLFPLSQAFVRIGGRILKLQEMSAADFDVIAANVGQLQLSRQDSTQMLLMAGFTKRYGESIEAGSPQAEGLNQSFPDTTILAPVVLANPMPRLPPSYHNSGTQPVVTVRGTVNRDGGIVNLEVVKGIDAELNRSAIETVQNSWRFLPAVSKGEVVDASVTLLVRFEP